MSLQHRLNITSTLKHYTDFTCSVSGCAAKNLSVFCKSLGNEALPSSSLSRAIKYMIVPGFIKIGLVIAVESHSKSHAVLERELSAH